MKLIIDRSKWRYGGEALNDECGPTKLLNSEGYMCCLGFYSLACGYTKDQISNKPGPESVVISEENKYLPGTLIEPITIDEIDYANSYLINLLMNDNDNKHLSCATREVRIKKTFEKLGVDVEFIGEYAHLSK